jgi:hypothetical protein
LDCRLEGAPDAQRFLLSAPRGEAQVEASEEALAVSHPREGRALLTLDRAARTLRTDAAASILGEVLDPLLAPHGTWPETDGRTRDAWLVTFEALGLYAGPACVAARTTALGSWSAGQLEFACGGTVLGPSDQLADLLHPSWRNASRPARQGGLARFALGEETPELPRLQSFWRVKRARQALFPPNALGHVLVCQPDGHWTALHHAEMGRQRLDLDVVRGWGALWSGPEATWLVTEHGQALRIPSDGNFGMYGTSEHVETSLRARPNPIGSERLPALLAGAGGFLVAVDPGGHTRWIQEPPAADGRGLVSQLAGMAVSSEGVRFNLGQLAAVQGARVFAATPSWNGAVFDVDGGRRWRSTATAGPDGHPVGAALHPDGRLAVLVSRTLDCFDASSGDLLLTVKPRLDVPLKPSVAFSPDGRFLVLQAGAALAAMDLVTRQVRHLLSVQDDALEPGDPLPTPSALCFSPDGQYLFTSRTNMHVFRWADLEAIWRRAPDLHGWVTPADTTVSPSSDATSRSA